jgi:hypothetical protein
MSRLDTVKIELLHTLKAKYRWRIPSNKTILATTHVATIGIPVFFVVHYIIIIWYNVKIFRFQRFDP